MISTNLPLSSIIVKSRISRVCGREATFCPSIKTPPEIASVILPLLPPKILSPNETRAFSSANNFSSSFNFVAKSEDDVYVYDPFVPLELLELVELPELLELVELPELLELVELPELLELPEFEPFAAASAF